MFRSVDNQNPNHAYEYHHFYWLLDKETLKVTQKQLFLKLVLDDETMRVKNMLATGSCKVPLPSLKLHLYILGVVQLYS